jgi:hypothetical protein
MANPLDYGGVATHSSTAFSVRRRQQYTRIKFVPDLKQMILEVLTALTKDVTPSSPIEKFTDVSEERTVSIFQDRKVNRANKHAESDKFTYRP